jgi:GntR family transcriptional regulator, galactonate operon transcriptional repressor
MVDALSEGRGYAAGRGLHGRIVEAIGRRILKGAIPPGSALPRESELMGEMGASRTSVREALRVLAAKGLVESRQRLGTRVRPSRAWNLLDPDVLAWQAAEGPAGGELTRHLVELRRLVEPPAARLAGERRGEAELAAVAGAFEAMRAAVALPEAYYRADLAFHRAVFAAAGNPFVDRLGAVVGAVLEVSFGLQRRSLIPFERGLLLHGRVLDAIGARDPAAAEAAMLDIIAAAQLELERALPPPEDGP